MIDPGVLHRLYVRAKASQWGIGEAQFGDALARSLAHSSGQGTAGAEDVERRCAALHLEELALACACEAGIDDAWRHFVLTYRPVLYRAADAIDQTGAARELADALYGDLFGASERDGTRQSLFRYFHGRSSLATWLRAVLAQRHIDRLRAHRSMEPLADEDPPQSELAVEEPDPERPRLRGLVQAAIAAAIALLAPRDRLRLGCYYAQQMTLAQVGRLTGEHEATVSRQLSRTRSLIRQTVEERLRAQDGLALIEVEECFRLIADDPGTLDLSTLVGSAGASKESAVDRSKRGTAT